MHLKQVIYNNQGFLSREQMEKVLSEILKYAKIVREFTPVDGEGNSIESLDQRVLEAPEIGFSFDRVLVDFSRASLSGAAGKSTAKAIERLLAELTRSGAALNHDFGFWEIRHAKLGISASVGLVIKDATATVSIDVDGKETSVDKQLLFFQDMISTGKLPIAVVEANGKLAFKPVGAKSEERLAVSYAAPKTCEAVVAFFRLCAHAQLRYTEMTWRMESALGDNVGFPETPNLIRALAAAKLPAKKIDLECAWNLKRWQDWPMLLTGANHYDKAMRLMPFQAAMPSGNEFQLWMSATPQKGFKFEVLLDSRQHMAEFCRLTTAKMKDEPHHG